MILVCRLSILVIRKNPTFAGSYDTPGDAISVFVSGDYAYIADGLSGLQVVEVKVSQFELVAVAQSLTIFSDSSVSLVRATLTRTDSVPSGTSITYYLSADNGLHWEQVTLGLEHSFTNTSYQLKWKAVLTTNNPVETPRTSSLSINYETETEVKGSEEGGFPWLWLGIVIVAARIGAAVVLYSKKE